MNKKRETRYRECPEFRADSEGKTLEGYASVFDSETDMGEFREVISPGAFTKTLQEADVRCLWNHNADIVLGRNKSGTLELSEDETGLKIKCLPSENSQQARDCVDAVKRGDVSQMSFGFYPMKDEWTGDGDKPLRIIREAALFDVSPVTYPAYEETTISLRAALEQSGLSEFEVNRIIPIAVQLDKSEVKESPEPIQANHSENSESGKPIKEVNHSPLALRKAQLKLMEINYNEYTRNDRQKS